MNNTFCFGEGVWQIDGVGERVELPPVESDDPVHVIGRAHADILWESVKIKAVAGEPVEMTASGTLPVHGMPHAPYLSITPEMLQHLKWHDEYRRQGKRYPRPRRCRSKARMSKQWRDRA